MARLISKTVELYYDYQGRYEFTLAPLNYYERQKIKFKLRKNIGLNKLDNCRVIKIGNRSVTKYITGLNLPYNNILTNLPSIYKLKLLSFLLISNQQLQTLPSLICNLKSLKYLHFYNNQLTELPSTICRLKSLIFLNLTYNNLTNLPSSICNLKSLKSLYINHNQLTDEYISNIRRLLPNCIVH